MKKKKNNNNKKQKETKKKNPKVSFIIYLSYVIQRDTLCKFS